MKNVILRGNKNFHLLSDQPADLAGLPARKLGFSTRYNNIDVVQNYFLAQKGLTRYALIETSASVLADDSTPISPALEPPSNCRIEISSRARRGIQFFSNVALHA